MKTASKLHKKLASVLSKIKGASVKKSLAQLPNGTYITKPKPRYLSQLHYKDKYWAPRVCGIICLQMVLEAVLKRKLKTKHLIKDGLAFDGYNVQTDVGWYHRALVLLSKSYSLNAQQLKYVSIYHIAKYVLSNKYVLASIESNNGGHLILVFGVVLQSGKVKTFIAHDPYNRKGIGENIKITAKQLKAKFKHNIIVINK